MRKPTKAQRAKAIRVLDAMLGLFADKKWIQNTYRRRNPTDADDIIGYCIVGALETCGDGLIAKIALKRAAGIITSLEGWNDAPKRTKRSVLATIRKAKKLIETGAI